MSKNAFIDSDVWKDDELAKLPLESKLLYLTLICGPDRKYIDVFRFSRRYLAMMMGVNESQLEVALKYLAESGFVETHEGYIGILKSYHIQLKGLYNQINAEREYDKLPDEIRKHFYPNGREVVKPVAKVKRGPKPESIKEIIAKQPKPIQQALTDFVEDRIERKKAPTTRAVKGWIYKLETMYPGKPEKQSESLYQSIERGWMGLFEVKEYKNSEDREFM